MLRCDTALGTASVIAEEISTGGKSIVRVLLDKNGEERIFLRAFVTESDVPAPVAAKKKVRKPRAKKKPETITDELLIERSRAPILSALDPLPDDSADYDDPAKFEAPGGSESVETV
ncbi:MAG TPA: hypothetical protein VFO39_02295 [Candidatus Sulfotelmatobacter sp.]|nr:hypothetical protein [Candidatus Sulfotelmatobacter sp.]